MTDILVSAGIIVLLILFGGLFVASEIALVSLRESQIKAMTGKRGKRVAHLAQSPNRFLATVQLVVTAAGFMSAAYGEARLSSHLKPVLEDAGLFAPLAEKLAAEETAITAELIGVQGSPADLGGYYYVDKAKTDAVMRPSETFNRALADF